jgi:hypothetical protein
MRDQITRWRLRASIGPLIAKSLGEYPMVKWSLSWMSRAAGEEPLSSQLASIEAQNRSSQLRMEPGAERVVSARAVPEPDKKDASPLPTDMWGAYRLAGGLPSVPVGMVVTRAV